MMALGTVVVHDARQDVDYRLPVTRIDLQGGGLHVEASATMPVDGSVEDGDVVSVYTPGGELAMRCCPVLSYPGFRFLKGEVFTLTLPMRLSAA